MKPRSIPPAKQAAPDTRELVALFQAGRYADVEILARQLLKRFPRAGFLWKALGAALQIQGKDALDALRQATAMLPGDAEAHSNLAGALRSAGLAEAALQSSARALQLKPDMADALCNHGAALVDLMRFDEAADSLGRAVKGHPRHALAWNNLGNAMQGLHRQDEAVSAYRQALSLVPNYAEAHNNLGKVLRDQSRLDDAAASFRQALVCQPGYAQAHGNLAVVLQEMGQFDGAIEEFQRALALRPGLAEVHYNLARTLRLLNRTDEAEAACHTALQLDPELVGALVLSGEFAADRGDFKQAEQTYRRAIELTPNASAAWAAIARVRKMTGADEAWFAAVRALAKTQPVPRDEAGLQYALGKAYDDIGEYAHAFSHYRRANELERLGRKPYCVREERQIVERIATHYGREWIVSSRAGASQSAQPVFIVGMPRSGTSLAEQILAAHPMVHGAGELPYWIARPFFDALPNQMELAALAEGYRDVLGRLAPGAARVTDKMPANYYHLGVIAAAFPRARIIHMQRNPVDTCLSIYFQSFNPTHTYSNDLTSLAHHFDAYRRLMAHWKAVLPEGMLLDVPYEGLVQDQEGWSRRIVDFVGMQWNDACLRFHESTRTVGTFSNWQVRQKINKASVERWRHYQAHIGPLLALLEPAA